MMLQKGFFGEFMKKIDRESLNNLLKEQSAKDLELILMLPTPTSYHQITAKIKKYEIRSNEIFFAINDQELKIFYSKISGSSKVGVLLPNVSVMFWVEINSFSNTLIKCSLENEAFFVDRRAKYRQDQLQPLEIIFTCGERKVKKLCVDIDENGFSCNFSKQELENLKKLKSKFEVSLKFSKLNIKLNPELRSLKLGNKIISTNDYFYGAKASFEIKSAEKEFYSLMTWLREQSKKELPTKK